MTLVLFKLLSKLYLTPTKTSWVTTPAAEVTPSQINFSLGSRSRRAVDERDPKGETLLAKLSTSASHRIVWSLPDHISRWFRLHASHSRRVETNCNLLDMAHNMTTRAITPSFLWIKSVNTATFILNQSPTKALLEVTPYQRLYYKKPDVSF